MVACVQPVSIADVMALFTQVDTVVGKNHAIVALFEMQERDDHANDLSVLAEKIIGYLSETKWQQDTPRSLPTLCARILKLVFVSMVQRSENQESVRGCHNLLAHAAIVQALITDLRSPMNGDMSCYYLEFVFSRVTEESAEMPERLLRSHPYWELRTAMIRGRNICQTQPAIWNGMRWPFIELGREILASPNKLQQLERMSAKLKEVSTLLLSVSGP